MNEAIQQIVERVWVNQIGVPPEWSDQEAEEFFQTEADRLSEMIGQLQIETQHAVIREWRAAHHGAEPDYLTQVGLINSARAQAEEIVLSQELYEQIPEEDLTAQEQAAQEEWEAEVRERESYFRLPEGDDPESVRRRTDPDRWRGVWRTAASEETEEAVKTVWPDRSIAFQVNMGLLWQSRIEDGTPVPRRHHPRQRSYGHDGPARTPGRKWSSWSWRNCIAHAFPPGKKWRAAGAGGGATVPVR